MRVSNLYEDFGTAEKPQDRIAGLNEDELEDQKLDSFERGYQAGWDDAVKAQAETQARISETLADSLRDLSFEHHEMRRTLTDAFKLIVTELIDKVLPETARASLGAHLKQSIIEHAVQGMDRKIHLSVCPDVSREIRDILTAELSETFSLVEDPALSPLQVTLRLGDQESEVDLDRTLNEMREAVSTFFATQMSEVQND